MAKELKIQDATNKDKPKIKKTFDCAVTSGFYFCNNLAHNNNTEMKFVSSGGNVLISPPFASFRSAYFSVIKNALIIQKGGFYEIRFKDGYEGPSRYECLKIKPRF